MNITDENRLGKKVEVSSSPQSPKDGMAWGVASFTAILFGVIIAVAGCSQRRVFEPTGSSAPLPKPPKHAEAGIKYWQWRDGVKSPQSPKTFKGERTTDKRDRQRKVNASTVNPVPIPDDGGTTPSDEFKK